MLSFKKFLIEANYNSDIINSLFGSDESAALATINDPRFPYYYLRDAVMSPHESVAMAAVKRDDFRDFEDAAKSPHLSVQMAALEHPEIRPDHFFAFLRHGKEPAQMAVVHHPNTYPEDLHYVFNDETPESVQLAAINNLNLPAHRISYAFKSPHKSVQLAALRTPRLPSNELSHVFDEGVPQHETVHLAAALNPNFPSYHLDRLFSSPFESVGHAAIESGNLDGYDLGKAFLSPHESVQEAAIKDHRIYNHSLIQALKLSPFRNIRLSAINHPKFISSEGLHIAMEHPDELVQLAALRHRLAESRHVVSAFTTPFQHESVQLEALKHNKFHPHDLNLAIVSRYQSVAMAALNHPLILNKYVRYAAQYSHHESVRQIAAQKLQEPNQRYT